MTPAEAMAAAREDQIKQANNEEAGRDLDDEGGERPSALSESAALGVKEVENFIIHKIEDDGDKKEQDEAEDQMKEGVEGGDMDNEDDAFGLGGELLGGGLPSACPSPLLSSSSSSLPHLSAQPPLSPFAPYQPPSASPPPPNPPPNLYPSPDSVLPPVPTQITPLKPSPYPPDYSSSLTNQSSSNTPDLKSNPMPISSSPSSVKKYHKSLSSSSATTATTPAAGSATNTSLDQKQQLSSASAQMNRSTSKSKIPRLSQVLVELERLESKDPYPITAAAAAASSSVVAAGVVQGVSDAQVLVSASGSTSSSSVTSGPTNKAKKPFVVQAKPLL